MEEELRIVAEKLDQVIERLDLLVILNIPPARLAGGGAAAAEQEVLQLCDMGNTAEGIAKKLRKSKHSIENLLSSLRKKGLVVSARREGDTVYARTTTVKESPNGNRS